MLGSSCNNGSLRYWYIFLSLNDLEFLLLPCVDVQGEICLDMILKLGKILVGECLIDVGVPHVYMVEELPDGDAIYSLARVVNFGIVDILDACC